MRLTRPTIHGLGTLAAAIALISLNGCSEDTQSKPQDHTTYKPAMEDDMLNETKTTAQDVKEKIGDAADAATKFATQQKAEYEQSLKDQLDKLDTQIAEFEKRGEKLTEQARDDFDKQLAELKEKRQEYAKSFEEFQTKSGDAWKEMKSGLIEAWDELKSATDRAAERFNQ